MAGRDTVNWKELYWPTYLKLNDLENFLEQTTCGREMGWVLCRNVAGLSATLHCDMPAPSRCV